MKGITKSIYLNYEGAQVKDGVCVTFIEIGGTKYQVIISGLKYLSPDVIDDLIVSKSKTWSSFKINDLLVVINSTLSVVQNQIITILDSLLIYSFETVEEALAELSPSERKQGLTVFITSESKEYWFKEDIEDSDFIEKIPDVESVVYTTGYTDVNLTINWDDVIPTETLTYREKHGDLDQSIQVFTERPSDILPNFWITYLNITGGKRYIDPQQIVISVDEGPVNYTIFSKKKTIVPTDEGYVEDDYVEDDYVY